MQKMSTSESKLPQEFLREIKLQINQRLFDAGLISSDVYRLAKESIVNEG